MLLEQAVGNWNFDRKKGAIIERLIESHRLARQLVNQNCSNLLFFFPDFLH